MTDIHHNPNTGTRHAGTFAACRYDTCTQARADLEQQLPTAEPEPDGPVQYGVRYTTGEISPTGGHREDAEALLPHLRRNANDPGAQLVQRTITATPWTNAPATDGSAAR